MAYDGNEKPSWNAASTECKKKGGDLLSITTPETQNDIQKLLTENNFGRCVYVGLQTIVKTARNIYR